MCFLLCGILIKITTLAHCKILKYQYTDPIRIARLVLQLYMIRKLGPMVFIKVFYGFFDHHFPAYFYMYCMFVVCCRILR